MIENFAQAKATRKNTINLSYNSKANISIFANYGSAEVSKPKYVNDLIYFGISSAAQYVAVGINVQEAKEIALALLDQAQYFERLQSGLVDE